MEPWASLSVAVEVRTRCRTVQTSHLTVLMLDLQRVQYLFKTFVKGQQNVTCAACSGKNSLVIMRLKGSRSADAQVFGLFLTQLC